MIQEPIAVTSRTFSRHPVLREELAANFANIQFNDEGLTLKGTDLVNFLEGKKGAIVALEPFPKETLSQLAEMKCISKFGVGLDNLDQTAMKELGIALGWSGGVNRRSVSELALAYALGIYRNVFNSSRQLAKREWKNAGGQQISEKTVGIIGCGFVGADTAKLFRAFDCKILINDLLDKSEFAKSIDAKIADKEEIFATADIISLHTPLTEETRNMITADTIAKMKENAIILNTARGNIIDEEALYSALKENKILGAAMDVFAVEPPLDSKLLDLENFFGTPHIGGSSKEAVLNMGRAAIENLKAYFSA